MDRREFIKTAFASGTMAVMLAGCSSGGSSSTGSTAGSSAGSAAVTDEGYSLVTEGTITVGTEGAYEPFEYYEDGELKGFDIELIDCVAEKLGLDIDYQVVDFDTIIPGVATGTKYDVGIAGITVTPEREKEIDFTDAYYMDDQAIIALVENADVTEDNYAEALNASGIKIAAQSGTTSVDFVEENYPEAEVVTFQAATDCFAALQSSQVNALVTNRSVGAQLIASSYDNCHVVGQVSTGEEYAIAVNQDNTALTEAINEALAELTDEGTIDELMEKYSIA